MADSSFDKFAEVGSSRSDPVLLAMVVHTASNFESMFRRIKNAPPLLLY
jgi:hypothetical protein